MDKLLFSLADEANEAVPYATIKEQVYAKMDARRTKRGKVIRYGSLAATLVLLLGVGTHFLLNNNLFLNEVTPQSSEGGIVNAESNYDEVIEDETAMNDRGSSPEAYMFDSALNAMPNEPPALGAVVAGDDFDNMSGGAMPMMCEYVGTLESGAYTLLPGDMLNFVSTELYTTNAKTMGEDVEVILLDSEHSILEPGWVIVNHMNAETLTLTWRATEAQYVILNAPYDIYSEQQLIDFVRRTVDNRAE